MKKLAFLFAAVAFLACGLMTAHPQQKADLAPPNPGWSQTNTNYLS